MRHAICHTPPCTDRPQVDGILFCVHRYFFSRDSVYFSTRFAQLGVRDHEASSTIVSLGDVECKDFEAFLSVLYPQWVLDIFFCFPLLRQIHLLEILKTLTFHTSTGDRFSTCPRAGASFHFASWHWGWSTHLPHTIGFSSLANTRWMIGSFLLWLRCVKGRRL